MEAAISGKPIHVDMTEMGHPECGAIAIIGGETEESITEDLRRYMGIPEEVIEDRTKAPKH